VCVTSTGWVSGARPDFN